MSNDKDLFSFELNESLYFEKGQEVSEMLGISLDPEITIQTFNEYISIRGDIELQGEYQKVNPLKEAEDIPLDFKDHHSRRYLEKIEDTVEGKASFSHRFPVEISVPLYRVANINDITVNVESFDYELPDENKLKLTSTIGIRGISNTDITQEANDVIEKEELFQFEITEIENREENQEDLAMEENDVSSPDQVDEIEPEITREDELDDPEEEYTETDRWKYKESQTLTNYFKNKSAKKAKNEEQEEVTPLPDDEFENIETEKPIESDVEMEKDVAEQEKIHEESAEKDRWKYKESQTISDFFKEKSTKKSKQKQHVEEQGDQEQELIEESVPVEQNIETKPDSAEGVDYLADLFRNNDANEEYAQMRICIVQHQDTLENIAERYEIPKLQLLQQNKLEDDSLVQGQLLSIPKKT